MSRAEVELAISTSQREQDREWKATTERILDAISTLSELSTKERTEIRERLNALMKAVERDRG